MENKEDCYCTVVQEGGWCLYYGLGKGYGDPGIMCKKCNQFKKNDEKITKSNHVDF